ncbi:MAG: cell division protein ZapB [Treponema sp.]|jgi:hypothetical protein|nr:cell division protein ZapB [Treponema sp.]
MITLDQVKLLETKVTKTIDYVGKVTEENSRLREKLDSCQKRVDELEALIQRFTDDQNRIEDGILASLERLNQFEDAIESVLSPGGRGEAAPLPSPETKPEPEKPEPPISEPVPEEDEKEAAGSLQDSGELDIF